MEPPPDVSVVIPTYNRAALLRRCVEALLSQETPAFRTEVIVVDDGSSDGTQELLRGFAGRVRSLRQENAGPARARNAGARGARGAILLFVDDDVLAQPGLIAAHARSHRTANAPCAVLGYTPIPESNATTPLMRHHRRRWDTIFEGMETDQREGRALPYYACCSLNFSIPRAAFLDTGLFDERFTRADFEDTELGYRLVDRGIPLRFCREAFAHHLFRTTLDEDCARNEKNGVQAGRLYPQFTYLKDRFRVSYALCEHRSWRTTARRLLIGPRSLKIVRVLIKMTGSILPDNIADYLYRLLEINYFAEGLRRTQ